MDYFLLQALHIGSAFALFTAIGAITLGSAGNKSAASILHGVSLLLILLIGFAMLKKPPMGQYWWVVKLGLWLVLGATPALAKRKVMPGWAVLVLALACGFIAAWLGLRRPF